ncbi:MAG: glutathione S-transferase family protein [Parvibaculum sp.]|uniref:glutathione binding-like protein n=1 Tax=Parvibaculum sp. TaxID=2024848 RepID=UPI0025D66DD5|nr:glutathione binding-like protein [Parvibaculum sp.]MCE9650728.1 glutathione S-transferase family protein [Parvibaculum sp.]
MDLYFMPLACSLATRIALYETGEGAHTRFRRVWFTTKLMDDGLDYRTVNPKGQVPALRLDDGTLLTEGAAVLQYVADRKPEAGIVPPQGTKERYRLQSLLNFIATELHKLILAQILDPATPEEAKRHAREVVAPNRLALLVRELAGRDFLLDSGFSIADAYAFFVLTLCPIAKVDLAPWPPLAAYYERMKARPTVARALAEEFELARAGV